MARRQCTDLTHGFPANSAVGQAFADDVGGLPGGKNQVLRRPFTLWHRKNFPNNGTTELQFFDESPALYVGNFFSKDALPANYAFAAMGMRISFLPGIDVNGSRTTVSSTLAKTALFYSAYGTTAADPTADQSKWHEKNRELIDQGQVVLEIGEREVFKAFGLNTFPAGGGYVAIGGAGAALENTNTTVVNVLSHNLLSGHNGDPNRCNRYDFGPPYPLMPNQQYKVLLNWKTAVDYTESSLGPLNGEGAGNPAGVLMVGIDGYLYTPGSA